MHLPHDLHLGCYKEEQQHLCFPRFSTPDGPLSFPLPLSLVESPSQFAEAHFLPPLPFLSLSLFPRRTLPPSRSLYFILFFFRFVSFFFSFVFLSQLSIHSAGIVYRLSEEISRELEVSVFSLFIGVFEQLRESERESCDSGVFNFWENFV
ncbi:hypothetical protein I3842_16G066800 [Carya illinoinensis]|uniref:Transmembrane protein n=1 Tax=Carya illinoinensis TaxID=32201 RepID=A0A922A0N5_CARIL|nr:hypothetical protein I3842_16G066800 [Carya illinoinensis]